MGLVLSEHSRYEYAALEGPRQIRLINIRSRKGSQLQCSVEIVDLDNAPLFTALSYTHGPAIARDEGDQEGHDDLYLVPLICDGTELSIKPNLASALNRFDQLGKHGYYWIDAVCINQQDLVERQNQVQMMGDIYYAADRVVVWLGEDDRDSQIIVVFIEYILPKFKALDDRERGKSGPFTHSFTNPLIYQELGIEYIPKEVWEGVADFFDRRWFHRAWTFQEALLAKDIDIFCGATKISWKRLYELLKYLGWSDWYDMVSSRHEASLQNEKYFSDKAEARPTPGASLFWTMRMRKVSFLKQDPEFQTYLGSIAGGSDNKDLILGVIDHLIYQMRARSATDPRDHYFSLYGVVSIFCDLAKLPNPLISPDYTKTIAEVYTANTKSLLAQSRSLLILSNVEDRSHRRRTDLPSWVPDMTVTVAEALPRHATGDIFNASKGALPQFLPAPNLEILSLIGHWIDTISDIGDNDLSTGRYGGPFEKSAAMLLKMPTVYTTGQDRVEAFWRTLVADVSEDGVHPAPATLGNAFREHLLLHNAQFLREGQDQGPAGYDSAIQSTQPLMALASSTPTAAALIPSLDALINRNNTRASIMATGEKKLASENRVLPDQAEAAWFNDALKTLNCAEADSLPFSRQMTRVMIVRTHFCTEGGLMGLGPRSLRKWDRVFVLPGARVPFVLRPVVGPAAGKDSSSSNSSDDRAYYELVGEAYIHGIMHGEALERGDEPKRIYLNLV